MYINLVHKNIGSSTTGDPEEGRCPSGADITVRVFAIHEDGKLTSDGYQAIFNAIEKALGERHNIDVDYRRSRVESFYKPGVKFAYTVYGNDASGRFDRAYYYGFNIEK